MRIVFAISTFQHSVRGFRDACIVSVATQAKEARPMEYPTCYRTTQIDGLSIFYREAGPKDAPTLLLLHGLPSSSRMFERGRHDPSFDLSEPEAYRRDVPDAEVHVLDAGHFALDTAADEIAGLIRGFVGSSR
jgi:pimeloyl-ACP methyl ester carboxylesterase